MSLLKFKSTLILSLISFSTIIYAEPAKMSSIDQLFKVTQVKKNVIENLNPKMFHAFGTTPEQYWKEVEPKLKKLYQSQLTEQEVQASLKFSETAEGKSLNEKMPNLTRQSSDIAIKALTGQNSSEIFGQ
ncbi:DUF2059 domain-containing protein [Acinetobacter stercoris]|uniref:DUF2059 domain-containing protein n=1 Tax=Acinetobacter stercoris TaxID=2126983 RepID=A0A2U3N1L9_9GAMM|nr:DUF2059 domain-containing protein [Acinetobacter stercoris]SPL71562.1 hypothetical protein KPC_2740 [Acinetobacter stercoris]